MLLVERRAAIADVEVAHLAPDAARIEALAAADTSTACDRLKQRIADPNSVYRDFLLAAV
jgi:hypothetical protein